MLQSDDDEVLLSKTLALDVIFLGNRLFLHKVQNLFSVFEYVYIDGGRCSIVYIMSFWIQHRLLFIIFGVVAKTLLGGC